MVRHHRQVLGFGLWGFAAWGLLACSASQGSARCDPSVDVCDTSATTDATTTTTSSTGSGGMGGASTTTSSTTGTGGGTTGTGGKAGSGGSGGGAVDAGRTIKKKIVAYLPTWSGTLGNWATDMPWNSVSQVNIAFAYPAPAQSTLTFNQNGVPGGAQDQGLDKFVMAAHGTGAKVLVSIGGAGAGSTQAAAQFAPANVDAFVTNIASFLDAHNVDGIDIDVEGNTAVNSNYGPFIDKLVAKLRPKGKLVTAALAQWFGNSISAATYALYDSVNVMAYDHCDTPNTMCSTYDSAVAELNFFKSKGVTADKLLLGVPFYCHCWGTMCIGQPMPCTGAGCQVAYAQVNVKFPGGMDDIQSTNANYSCNGPATIAKKAQLALGYAGMMAWEITQDAGGANSLLKVMVDNLN
jgi:GH18 family chitinase